MPPRMVCRYGLWASLGAASLAALVASACLVSQDGSPSLIDGGDLGVCSGNEARTVPASTCPNQACCGDIAFALCLGTTYSDCSCTLLDGSVLVNAAGEPIDAASIDLKGDCGAPAEEAGEAAGQGDGGGSGSPGEAGHPKDSGGRDAAAQG